MARRIRQRGVRAAAAVLAIGCLGALAFARPLVRGEPQAGRVWQRVFFDGFDQGLRRARWGRYSGQPSGDPGGWWAPSHAAVRRGTLELETYRDRRFGYRWVSGGVSSAPALRQTYGKYLVRLRMDRARGVAFVALLWPSRGRWPPEIDFAENGGETGARSQVTATLHYGADNAQLQRTLRGDFTRWHVLGVEWTPGRLAYTVDGRVWAAISGRAVPSVPMELDLQAQAGTCGDRYAPCPNAATPPRSAVHVDWVAAYEYKGFR
jgi:beta-glucanase (GH16 family)